MSDSQLASIIDDLAVYLALAASAKGKGEVGMSYFSGLEVFIPGMASVVQAKHGDDANIDLSTGLGDVSGFDVSMLCQAEDSSTGLFGMGRHRRVTLTQVRGRVVRPMPFMVEGGYALLQRSGKLLTSDKAIWGSVDGKSNWRCIGPHDLRVFGQSMTSKEESELRISMGIHFVRDYDWGVRIGYAGYPTINFPTDPVGVLEVFRLRDIPEGKSRRDALLHWVSGHWRKKRNDPDALVKVREHLRGKRDFVWNGLRCTVRPSPYDLRKLDAAKESA